MTWQRARSEEQKERRVSEIVTATARFYEKHAFEDIGLNRIEIDFETHLCDGIEYLLQGIVGDAVDS